ncbi:proline dehydrogenase family protein, partial [Flavobacterium sp.]|uniref:proline dehydrogenase family protein n=1 Tax=Flavobacterium sp. TaxID=239 RepID=UPI003C4C5EB9
AIVYNTLQMYRHDRLHYLKELQHLAVNEGFFVGVKLVRGAYLEKEKERAFANNYPSPICETKEITESHYNEAILYVIENLETMALFLGTHNEKSNYYLMELIQEKGIQPTDTRIWFGQLYGMSDHISYNLAQEHYNVAKYLPFGPVKDVMPYLIRRAEENTSVVGQTNRELELIKKERERRKKSRK